MSLVPGRRFHFPFPPAHPLDAESQARVQAAVAHWNDIWKLMQLLIKSEKQGQQDQAVRLFHMFNTTRASIRQLCATLAAAAPTQSHIDEETASGTTAEIDLNAILDALDLSYASQIPGIGRVDEADASKNMIDAITDDGGQSGIRADAIRWQVNCLARWLYSLGVQQDSYRNTFNQFALPEASSLALAPDDDPPNPSELGYLLSDFLDWVTACLPDAPSEGPSPSGALHTLNASISIMAENFPLLTNGLPPAQREAWMFNLFVLLARHLQSIR